MLYGRLRSQWFKLVRELDEQLHRIAHELANCNPEQVPPLLKEAREVAMVRAETKSVAKAASRITRLSPKMPPYTARILAAIHQVQAEGKHPGLVVDAILFYSRYPSAHVAVESVPAVAVPPARPAPALPAPAAAPLERSATMERRSSRGTIVPVEMVVRFTHVGPEAATPDNPRHVAAVQGAVDRSCQGLVEMALHGIKQPQRPRVVKMEEGSIILTMVLQLIQPIDDCGACAFDLAIELKAAIAALPAEAIARQFPGLSLDQEFTRVRQLTIQEITQAIASAQPAAEEEEALDRVTALVALNETMRVELSKLMGPLRMQREQLVLEKLHLQAQLESTDEESASSDEHDHEDEELEDASAWDIANIATPAVDGVGPVVPMAPKLHQPEPPVPSRKKSVGEADAAKPPSVDTGDGPADAAKSTIAGAVTGAVENAYASEAQLREIL